MEVNPKLICTNDFSNIYLGIGLKNYLNYKTINVEKNIYGKIPKYWYDIYIYYRCQAGVIKKNQKIFQN